MQPKFALSLFVLSRLCVGPPALSRRFRPSRPRWLRLAAMLVSCLFLWSVVLATPVYALTHQPSQPRPGVRTLTPEQMSKIIGSQHVTPVSSASGDIFPWEASHNGTNTGNGNKLTSIPIVSWTARGGMPVSFVL